MDKNFVVFSEYLNLKQTIIINLNVLKSKEYTQIYLSETLLNKIRSISHMKKKSFLNL